MKNRLAALVAGCAILAGSGAQSGGFQPQEDAQKLYELVERKGDLDPTGQKKILLCHERGDKERIIQIETMQLPTPKGELYSFISIHPGSRTKNEYGGSSTQFDSVLTDFGVDGILDHIELMSREGGNAEKFTLEFGIEYEEDPFSFYFGSRYPENYNTRTRADKRTLAHQAEYTSLVSRALKGKCSKDWY